MTPMPDLVRITKLDTQFLSDPKCVQHVKYVTKSATERRRVAKEEKWRRQERLGQGAFGIVWSERCVQGDMKGEVRAVKKVQKFDSGDCHRELEAIALFSHTKYEQCFVKSLGWYDDDDSIFITMEYLPNGDLHKYLTSSLPEPEGQVIVSQVLEGLQFMHDNGFAHRDLKPANVLIVCKGPDWWVKIADFGISKRATEGLSALRTRTGTPAFTAPEVLGFLHPDDASTNSYTNSVDIWSVGVIAFLILTNETLFKDPSLLNRIPSSSRISLDNTSLDDSVPEPSASWSTQDQISAHGTHGTTGTLVERAIPAPKNSTLVSTPEVATQTYWSTRSKLKGHSKTVVDVAFSPDGKQIVSVSQDRTVRLWDSATGAARATLKGHLDRVVAVAFSPDGKQIASASLDKTVRLWDSATGAAHVILEGHSNWGWAVVFSPDGRQIASASRDRTVRLWDSTTGAARATLKGHSGGILAVAFSPDGKQIASASGDKTVRLWNSTTGAARAILKGHSDSLHAVAFSPDGRQIASASKDKTVRLWDSTMGTAHTILEGHSESVNGVAFSPDGKQIASASGDKTVKLWDSATGAAHAILEGHSDKVLAVVFSPDGKQIASASSDNTIRLWDSTTGAARKQEKMTPKHLRRLP